MRIGVSGTQRVGKSTFVKDFLNVWKMYKVPEKRYSDFIEEKKLKLNKEGDEESQKFIRDFMIDQIIETKKEDYIIFDRTPLDNLVYTLWLSEKDVISNDFVIESIQTVKHSLCFFDLIIFLPICENIPVEERNHRDNDESFRIEINLFFKSLYEAYVKNSSVFFPFDTELGCPGIFEIYGDREERIRMMTNYINDKGNLIEESSSCF